MTQPETSPAVPPALQWRRMLVLNFVISCACTVLVWAVSPKAGLRFFVFTFAFCLVFANGFGLPAAFLIAAVAKRQKHAELRFPYNWIAAATMILVFTLFGTFLGMILLRAVGFVEGASLWGAFVRALPFAVVVAMTVGMGTFAWESQRELLDKARREIERRELAEAQARKLLAEARLASLESRIRPHFLFNTLNSIAALIPEDPKRAEETVQRLAALLRFSLDSAHERLVDLGQECRVVADYLEIEQARFGPRLRVAIDLEPGTETLLVPPLAIQTLVENSVKHAVAQQREGAEVRLSARVEGDRLELCVTDSGPGFELEDAPQGHGLDNLRERLAGLFGDKATLTVGRTDAGGACVSLRLPATGTGAERA